MRETEIVRGLGKARTKRNAQIAQANSFAEGLVPSIWDKVKSGVQAVGEAITPSHDTATTALQPVSDAVTANSGLTGSAVSAAQDYNKRQEEAMNSFAEGLVPAEPVRTLRGMTVQAPQPAPQPAVPATTQTADAPQQTLRSFGDSVKAMASNSLAKGTAFVEGPGSGTSDSVPARLSHGEAVLPAKTVAKVGAGNLARLIQQTNDGVAPKQGLRTAQNHFAAGDVPAWNTSASTPDANAYRANPTPAPAGADIAADAAKYNASDVGKMNSGAAPAPAPAPAPTVDPVVAPPAAAEAEGSAFSRGAKAAVGGAQDFFGGVKNIAGRAVDTAKSFMPAAAQEAPSASYDAGKKLGQSMAGRSANTLMSQLPSSKIGLAADVLTPALAATNQGYQLNPLSDAPQSLKEQFMSDPNVGTWDKTKQFAEDAQHVVLPTALGAIGAGAGSVTGPGAILTGLAGGAAGQAASMGIDKLGGMKDGKTDAFAAYERAHAQPAVVGNTSVPAAQTTAAQSAPQSAAQPAVPAPQPEHAPFTELTPAQTMRANSQLNDGAAIPGTFNQKAGSLNNGHLQPGTGYVTASDGSAGSFIDSRPQPASQPEQSTSAQNSSDPAAQGGLRAQRMSQLWNEMHNGGPQSSRLAATLLGQMSNEDTQLNVANLNNQRAIAMGMPAVRIAQDNNQRAADAAASKQIDGIIPPTIPNAGGKGTIANPESTEGKNDMQATIAKIEEESRNNPDEYKKWHNGITGQTNSIGQLGDDARAQLLQLLQNRKRVFDAQNRTGGSMLTGNRYTHSRDLRDYDFNGTMGGQPWKKEGGTLVGRGGTVRSDDIKYDEPANLILPDIGKHHTRQYGLRAGQD